MDQAVSDTLAKARGDSDETADFGFMRFVEFNHGRWSKLFAPHFLSGAEDSASTAGPPGSVVNGTGVAAGLDPRLGLGYTRFVFGNPLVALTMMREDVEAGFHVPVGAMFTEEQGGGTKATLLMPSSLMAGDAAAARVGSVERWDRLMDAAHELEEKILKLMEYVMH